MKKVIEAVIQNDFEVTPCEIGEMATINPRMCNSGNVKLQIEIEERNEGPVPHLHVYLGQDRDPRNCVYVQLNDAVYSNHHNVKSPKTFDKKQKNRFIEIMTAVWSREYTKSIVSDEIRPATGYEAAVQIWLDCYGEKYPNVKFNYDEDGFLIMPDYSKL